MEQIRMQVIDETCEKWKAAVKNSFDDATRKEKAREKTRKEKHMRKHKFAIYFTWNDGFEDADNVESRQERDMVIRDMINRNEFKEISYCRIYANGEYGKLTKVL